MAKGKYHPNAYLSRIKNVKLGLKARTQLLNVLDNRNDLSADCLSKETGLHYAVVMHHLRLLENEGIIESKSSRPILWKATGSGQSRLDTRA